LYLLRSISQTGSIAAAAKQTGMTYKVAWYAVDAMNNIACTRLVSIRHGGAHGKDAKLTQAGSRLITGPTTYRPIASGIDASLGAKRTYH